MVTESSSTELLDYSTMIQSARMVKFKGSKVNFQVFSRVCPSRDAREVCREISNSYQRNNYDFLVSFNGSSGEKSIVDRLYLENQTH